MRDIIIATASSKLMSALCKMLLSFENLHVSSCKSGSEVMAYAAETENAVLLCGPLKDVPSIYLAKTVPDGWDVILLLSSNEPFPYYVSNIVPVTLPISRSELVAIINETVSLQGETYAAKATAKKVRPKNEREIIENAKKSIMNERNISENDAHKFLQHYSMNLGITLVEAAKRFL